MPKNDNISISVIRRLPRYYRYLKELKAKGIMRISSRELAEMMGATSSQVRQDLNCFGGFGNQGYGYGVNQLCAAIHDILGLERKKAAVLIGVGNLGRTVANFISRESEGVNLIGLFDSDSDKVGVETAGLKIRPASSLEAFLKKNSAEIAVICVPADSSGSAVELLINLGVKCFWNFSHYDIAHHYPGAVVENVHLSDSLMTLLYRTDNK